VQSSLRLLSQPFDRVRRCGIAQRSFIALGAAIVAFGCAALALAFTAAIADAAAWSTQTVPVPVVAYGQLSGVSCPSAASCIAVGSYPTATGDVALAQRWNGSQWLPQSAPNPAGATAVSLAAVACRSARACIAVGSFTDARNRRSSLVERWNGTAWKIQRAPRPHRALGWQLDGVSCSSARRCIAVGSAHYLRSMSRVLIEKWNGSAWTIQRPPKIAGPSSFSAVSCPSPTACTAVGSAGSHTLAERWNGSRWLRQRTPDALPPPLTENVLSGVSCPSSSFCVAVGTIVQYAGDEGPSPVIGRWNGSRWTISSPGFGTLSGVSCRTARDCIAVGSSFQGLPDEALLAARWNGAKWKIGRSGPTPANGAEVLPPSRKMSCPGWREAAVKVVGPPRRTA
jgi:hypothetical protein